MSDLRPIEPLDSKRHHAKTFDCGQLQPLVAVLRQQPSPRDNVARTFVPTNLQPISA